LDEIFDAKALRAHRTRAAGRLASVQPLLDDLADRLLDRLDDMRQRFDLALDLGGRGSVAPKLRARGMAVISADISAPMALCAGGAPVCVAAELLPFAAQKFDLVVASFSLHWINDLPGVLIQLRRALKPGGLLLASMPVLGTLGSLRDALLEAEDALTGAVSPRLSPFPDLKDCAGLLQRAGFAVPVADVEDIELLYANPFALLQDLRAAGETNAVLARRKTIPHRGMVPMALAALPQRDGRYVALLRMATMTGWG
jgi:SAM-dependent methyltransferase